MAKKTSNIIQHNRKQAYLSQSKLCYYCGLPMWEDSQQTFRLNYKLSLKSSNLLRCTAEHLIARQDGGKNSKNNIVAACQFCNQTRHKAKYPLPPDQYMIKVKNRMNSDRWHPLSGLRQKFG